MKITALNRTIDIKYARLDDHTARDNKCFFQSQNFTQLRSTGNFNLKCKNSITVHNKTFSGSN